MQIKVNLENRGYQIRESIYSAREVDQILSVLNDKDIEAKFGVREFLNDKPELVEFIFTDKLLEIIHLISPSCDKSIYFDKPPNANWVVNWHQDLTINVRAKKETPGYKNWRVQLARTIVQPPRAFLEHMFTIRIHLDDCKKENGALRVIEGSHKYGVIQTKDWVKNKTGEERICEVNRGGILIMKPLILHASRRTENEMNRRVIHIEFCDQELPDGLEWSEAIPFR